MRPRTTAAAVAGWAFGQPLLLDDSADGQAEARLRLAVWLAAAMVASHGFVHSRATAPSARMGGVTPPTHAHLRRWGECCAAQLVGGAEVTPAPLTGRASGRLLQCVAAAFDAVYYGCVDADTRCARSTPNRPGSREARSISGVRL